MTPASGVARPWGHAPGLQRPQALGRKMARSCKPFGLQQRRTATAHASAWGSEGAAATAAAAAHAHAAAYDLADAAAAAAAAPSTSGSGDFLSPLTDTLELVLKSLQSGLDTLHVPYSFGWSIVLLTVLVKIATLPLTKQQVESSMAVQSLRPRVENIKARYGEDKDRVSKETSALYEKAGVNPLAGCLPSVATIPIFIGLYRSLTHVAEEGLLDTQGFFWIPNLAGPTTIAANRAGAGTAWLYPLVDGAPPIGWHDALAYCAVPAALVVAQWVSSSIISPPVDPTADNARTQKVLGALLPLMVGWFALNVPAGLGLYYLSNTVLTSATQIWLRKLGGANVQVRDLGPVTKVGAGRRLGALAREEEFWQPPTAPLAAGAAEEAQQGQAAAPAGAGAPGQEGGPRLAKRKKAMATVSD